MRQVRPRCKTMHGMRARGQARAPTRADRADRPFFPIFNANVPGRNVTRRARSPGSNHPRRKSCSMELLRVAVREQAEALAPPTRSFSALAVAVAWLLGLLRLSFIMCRTLRTAVCTVEPRNSTESRVAIANTVHQPLRNRKFYTYSVLAGTDIYVAWT